MASSLPYLQAYPAALQQQVAQLLAVPQGIEQWLLRRHPQAHALRSDKALYAYVDALKTSRLRKAGVLHTEKVQDQESQVARDKGTEIHAALEAAAVGAGFAGTTSPGNRTRTVGTLRAFRPTGVRAGPAELRRSLLRTA